VKVGELLDEQTASAVGAAWLREALRPASEYGARIFAEQPPFRPGDETAARRRSEHIVRIAASLGGERLDAARDLFRNVPDAASAVARASMGSVLEDAEFLELQRFFDACARIDALLGVGTGQPRSANDAVTVAARALELGRAGRFGFYLADAFDAELARSRAAAARAQAEYDAVRSRARERIVRELGREISGDEFIVMRADLSSALPSGVRVVREAPTYVLCALDADEASLAALERRDLCAVAVAEAEERVRARLSQVIRDRAAALDDAMRAFGALDVTIAAARFAHAHGCVAPEYDSQRRLEFTEGRFIPLALELEREGRAFTPVSFALEGVAVLTGPNMGGKSVCLRTCGFIAVCAAFGVPVPARHARTAIFDEIAWLGVGGDGEIGGLLSTFAREVVRLRELLARGRMHALVLLDEFARTTTPLEGKALLVAVIARLCEGGATGLAATHLSGVARAAGVRHYAVRGLRGIPRRPETNDLAAALATLGASMDYTVEETSGDERGRSDAIALASLLGLDDALTDAARAAMEE
jgi:DNA mismatch repair protein MutS2